MRVEQIDRLETLAPHLRVEIRPARREAAHLQNREHDLSGEIDARRELVGVPAEQLISGVGVDRTKRVGRGGDLQFVLHGVAGERGVVRFKVELEMVDQVVFAQEVQTGGSVGVVLMLGRLLGLRLDVELAFKSELLLVIHRHVEKHGEMVHFAFEVRVEQRAVTLASAPENITFTVEFVGDFQRLLHLRCGVGKHVRVATGGRAMDVARMREQTGRAPKQFDAGALLFLFQHLDDRIEIFVGFPQVLAFGRHVAVVKGVKRRAELLDEFKRHPRAVLRVLHRVRAVVPRAQRRPDAERIGQWIAKRVPINHRKAEMVLHRPAFDHFIRVVMFESERVPRLRAFVFDFRDVRKRGWHKLFLSLDDCERRLYRLDTPLARHG